MAAPPKKKRSSSKPASKQPRKKTAKTKVRQEAPKSKGTTSEKLDIFPDEPETKQAQQSKKDDGFKTPGLRVGDAGIEVRQLQEDLIKAGLQLSADGTFGRDTERAVRSFQKDNGLEPIGIADPETIARLRETIGEKSDEVSVKLQAVSDRPLEDKEEDALGFAQYVDAMVAFLRSQDTLPPLAMGINAPWGRGKTSFMNMLDSELKKTSSFFGPVRFATEWFNPWKYSNYEQVWAAFVGIITKSVRDALGISGRLNFEARRFWNNVRTRKMALLIRVLVFAAMTAMFLIVALDSDIERFTHEFVKNEWGANATDALKESWVGEFIPWLGGILLMHLFYIKVIRQYNINLFDYLKRTNFKDKIGTLSQFEKEMQLLNDCMPKQMKLKIVVFVDDLDRCRPAVLWEVIEALQLLAVSQRCIFILGMDLQIVANTIKDNYSQLSQKFIESDGNLQQGWGYRFLEKIIQTRLSVPAYETADVSNLIARTLGQRKAAEDLTAPAETEATEPESATPELAASDSKEEIPKDSDEVVEIMGKFGSAYFENPRRLKRFINNFRLHAYLAMKTGFKFPLNRLARFIVLTEKWPGLVDFFQNRPSLLDEWQKNRKLPKPRANTEEMDFINNVENLLNDQTVAALLTGEDDEFAPDEFIALCRWYGFRYYK